MGKPVPFTVGNAFTDRIDGGNPAAVVHLPSLAELSDETLQVVARNFNQPMTCFFAHDDTSLSEDNTVAVFKIRWFTNQQEVPLCGHATAVTANMIWKQGIVPPSVTTLRFEAPSGAVITARAVEESRVEIVLDLGAVTELTSNDDARLRDVLTRALGADVGVRFAGGGQGQHSIYMVAEVDTEGLGGIKVNTNAFMDSPFLIHVIVARSSDPDVTFEVRMFAPRAGVAEDPACGSAHCVSVPYWVASKGVTGTVVTKHVSARGGETRITVDNETQKIKIAGKVRTVSKGELYV
ncbi:hypothetical protein BC834DRAFT_906519 [Gloeopeniophorella convolvens]|nr:hypothetical protein BC834DRAFT_906519 [Gloeopeniophorella convolvens]